MPDIIDCPNMDFCTREMQLPVYSLPDWEKNWERRQEFWTLSGMLAVPGDSRSDGRTEQTENSETGVRTEQNHVSKTVWLWSPQNWDSVT
jgi:hypothetical protein